MCLLNIPFQIKSPLCRYHNLHSSGKTLAVVLWGFTHSAKRALVKSGTEHSQHFGSSLVFSELKSEVIRLNFDINHGTW